MKPGIGIAFFLAALAAPAGAQEAVPCDWAARADGIVEPWEAHTATFANGDVRLALIDTVEPAAGAFHLLILSPPLNELGERQCRTLGMAGMGFAGLDFATLEAAYDPARGLVFTMAATRYDGEAVVPAMLEFSLNQATGAVHAVLR